MTCEACREKDRRIAQLQRDLAESAAAVDVFKNKWLEIREKGKVGK